MALLPRHKTPPVFQPIIARETATLTDDEMRRLETIDLYADWLSAKERAYLAFVAWRFRQGDSEWTD